MVKGSIKLPIFMSEAETNHIFHEVVASIPKNTRVFLVGGAIRNALYYRYFSKALPKRDYDLLLIGDVNKFVSNLRRIKFTYGKIRRKHEIVLKKKKISKPKHLSDYVYLDIHISKEKNIKKNIKENSNFTINCSALPLKEVISENWSKKIISLPFALTDLKNKQIWVNKFTHPANLYACIRFMSKGFKKPSKKEIEGLLFSLKKLEKYKFKRNVNKVFDYVGGEKKARQLSKRLGIKENIFDFETIRRL